MPTDFEDRFITLNGLKLHYLDWDAGPKAEARRPMVLLHGVTGHARLWDHVARTFRGEFHVLAVDMRGHGDSQWSPEGAYETTDLASDLTAFFEELGLRKAVVIGLSWGGLVGLIHTAEYPDTVQELILVDVGCEFDQSETDIPARPRVFEDEQSLERWERSANPYPALWTLRQVFRASVMDEDGKLVRKHDPMFFKRWPFRNMAYWDYARQVRCPTLLLRGARSIVLSEGLADRTAQAIPNCRLEAIPDAAHLIPLDNPPAFKLAVHRFLTE